MRNGFGSGNRRSGRRISINPFLFYSLNKIIGSSFKPRGWKKQREDPFFTSHIEYFKGVCDAKKVIIGREAGFQINIGLSGAEPSLRHRGIRCVSRVSGV
jgi:hypothetical protein